MVLGLCILLLLIAVLASLWKEGLATTIALFLSNYGVNPFIAIGVGVLVYLVLFVGEKIKNGSKQDV